MHFDLSGPKVLLLAIVLSVALVLSLIGNVASLVRGQKVDFVWLGDTGDLHHRLGAVPEQYFVDIAKLVVGTLGNTTARTMIEAVESVRPYLESPTFVAMRATAERESRMMDEASLSIMTTGIHAVDVKDLNLESKPITRIHLKAIRTMFAGALPIEPHEITVVMDIDRSGIQQARSAQRPITIVGMMWPPLRMQDGQFQDFEFRLDRMQQKGKRSGK